MLAQFASLCVIVLYLVVEHREVQRESQSDRVARPEVLVADFLGGGVLLLGACLDLLEFSSLRALGDISVVVTGHLVEEGLALAVAGLREALVLDQGHDALALVVQPPLDLLLVDVQAPVVLRVLRVLLDGRDGPDGRPVCPDEVLEANAEEIALFGCEVLVLEGNDLLEEVEHIVKALSLFGNADHEYLFLHFWLISSNYTLNCFLE